MENSPSKEGWPYATTHLSHSVDISLLKNFLLVIVFTICKTALSAIHFNDILF